MLRVGEFLGDRYEILEKIGSGGMADVYKARCHKLNRWVAIKVLKPEFCNDKNLVSRFKVEAQAAAGLSHPNIVNIYDVGDEGDIHYIVMELVEGITLKEYIEKKGRLEIRESIGITIQIAQGIGAAHAQHIIHRDIKPQNVIISRDGKVKVTDFGIAKAASSDTINSEAVGSVYYFSPEQARGGYCDERSDIYSLGITLYEMLTGRVPFDGETTVAVALAHLQTEMTPPRQIEPMIPVSLEKIILKATQKKPERRYASAEELIADLRKALVMPEEDFVKVVPLNNTSPTVLISEDEISKIRQSSKSIPIAEEDDEEVIPVKSKDEAEEEEEDLEESTTFDKIVLGVGIFVAVAVIGLAIFILYTSLSGSSFWGSNNSTEATSSTEISDKQVLMPDLLGKTAEEAYEILQELSLGIKREYGYSDSYEKDLIYQQEYEPDTVIDKNLSVTVYISLGSGKVSLPDDMVGKSAQVVIRELVQLGLSYDQTYEYSEEVEEGNVIRTDPASGEVDAETVVTLVISKGTEIVYVLMPDLSNYTVDEANELLAGDTLSIGTVTEEYSDTVDEGKIISQSVNRNTQVETGSTVDVVVSLGKEYVNMPDLSGMTQSEAEDALTALNLNLGEVSKTYDADVDAGKVVSQSVEKDTRVKIDSSVDIVISMGAELVSFPSLSGKTEEQIKTILTEKGLVAGNFTYEENSSVTPGIFLRCNYQAGAQVEVGTVIDIVLAKAPETVSESPQE